MIESIVLLQTIGGDCPEDSYLLAGDTCLERGLGYAPPRPTAVRGFLERFHDESLEQLRPSREQQLSFIVPSSLPVQGLQQVQVGGVQRIAALYEQHGQRLSIATIDQDATIVAVRVDLAKEITDVRKEIADVRKEITIQTRWILAVLGGAAVLIPILQRVMAALIP